jgi:asparagine synthase (glutamine-hydrolysing)
MNRWTLNLTHRVWHEGSSGSNQRLSLKGRCYLDDKPTNAEALASFLDDAQTPDELETSLQRLNGFYSWVTQSDTKLSAGVDHVRSCPLFYGQANGQFYLSDDAEWVREQVGDHEMDPVAREEFQLTGYVTGNETLFPNVKQLQAGEFLVATHTEQGTVIKTHRYYRFLHTEPATYDEAQLREQLDHAATRSIQRLIDYANGRQIVVPLSGGYDSRLIVTLLKRLGHENVLTFTYGVPGNKESEYSQRVADALGLRWHFVEYSEDLWREAWQTPERWDYQMWGSGWTSVSHLQDWLAVKIMKEQGVLSNDCIFAPGHTGDFISGGHIPKVAFEKTDFAINDTLSAVFDKHYSLAPINLFRDGKGFWKERIHSRIERDHISYAWECADTFEKWEWQERQAKFICNSVRVYEFFGYDWWMPLWDSEFIWFWENVPIQLRKDRTYYLSYVSDLFSQYAGNNLGNLGNALSEMSVVYRLRKLPFYAFMSRIGIVKALGKRLLVRPRRKGHLAFEARFDSIEYENYLKKGISLNGMVARDFILDPKVLDLLSG